jgi:molybdopterin-containing oxidoreductase family membrane subunit
MEGTMATDISVIGLFLDEQKTAAVIEDISGYPWQIDRVHSPFPSHKIFDALKLKKSPVGWFTLVGGILGFFIGFGLAIYTALEWKLIVWGKPIVAWIPFVIVGFECTILFSVFANVLGLIVLGNLPDYKGLEKYDSRCSADHFGIVVSCEQEDREKVVDFFKNQGGEVTIFD